MQKLQGMNKKLSKRWNGTAFKRLASALLTPVARPSNIGITLAVCSMHSKFKVKSSFYYHGSFETAQSLLSIIIIFKVIFETP